MSVDLFLGGPLGLWALDQVDAWEIGNVYTRDLATFERARALNVPVYMDLDVADLGMRAVGLSFHYPRIFKSNVLDRYEYVYNIHPALLPWGKCYYPVFWALWAGEPAGCTLHEIDEGIDSGPIITQREVQKYNWDTGGTLHARVSAMEKALFLEFWPRIVSGTLPEANPQPPGGSFHYKREFFALKHPEGIATMSADDLLRLVRCLSHPDYDGLRVVLGGRQYEVSARGL